MSPNPLVSLGLACCWGLSLSAIEVPQGFAAETLVTGLEAVTALSQAPDGRLFIAEQTGKIRVWKEGRLLSEPALVLPVSSQKGRGLIGLALAPDFPHPPHLFVLYVAGQPVVHLELARFKMEGDQADPASRVVLLEGEDQSALPESADPGLPGGVLCFKPDGTLLVGIADHTAGEAGQRPDTLQGKIYCLQPDGTIPRWNPHTTRLDRRFHYVFANGVRHPSGLAVQPRWEGGRVFFADSGSGPAEINELVAGSNYGEPGSPTSLFDALYREPLYADWTGAIADIAGGTFCSRRSHWPSQWRGRFFFASFSGNWIGALDTDRPTNTVQFARGLDRPVALEFEPDGSLLVLNRGADGGGSNRVKSTTGSLVRIRWVDAAERKAEPPAAGRTDPHQRVALGLPTDPRDLPKTIKVGELYQRLSAAGGQQFWLNHLPWVRGVFGSCSMALPPGQRLRISAESEVLFPPGTVFVRTYRRSPAGAGFSNGKGSVTFETRLTVVGEPWGYGASYRWRPPHPTPLDEAEDADLVEKSQLAEVGVGRWYDPKTGQRISHEIVWRFPGVDDHLSWPSRNPDYHLPTSTWELSSLLQATRLQFDPPLPTNAWRVYGKYPSWPEAVASDEEKVRSYLHGNCAICHQPGGAAPGKFDVRLTTALAESGLIDGLPVAGDLGIPGARLIVPGEPEKSLLYQRLVRPEPQDAPPGVHYQEDLPIAPILEDWIRGLAPRR